MLNGNGSTIGLNTNIYGIKRLLQEFEILAQYLPYLFGAMIFMIIFQFILSLIRGKLLALSKKRWMNHFQKNMYLNWCVYHFHIFNSGKPEKLWDDTRI